MFTLSEFKLAKEKCPDEMRKLFKSVSITFPGWEAITLSPQEWDGKITRRVCDEMGSSTISEGYARLLNAAEIGYRLGNPDEMLASIIAHKAEILDAIVYPISKILLSLVDSLLSEADKNPNFNAFLKGEPKLKSIINRLKRACNNFPHEYMMTEDEALRMFELLEQIRAVKVRI